MSGQPKILVVCDRDQTSLDPPVGNNPSHFNYVYSPLKAISRLAHEQFDAVYFTSEHFDVRADSVACYRVSGFWTACRMVPFC